MSKRVRTCWELTTTFCLGCGRISHCRSRLSCICLPLGLWVTRLLLNRHGHRHRLLRLLRHEDLLLLLYGLLIRWLLLLVLLLRLIVVVVVVVGLTTVLLLLVIAVVALSVLVGSVAASTTPIVATSATLIGIVSIMILMLLLHVVLLLLRLLMMRDERVIRRRVPSSIDSELLLRGLESLRRLVRWGHSEGCCSHRCPRLCLNRCCCCWSTTTWRAWREGGCCWLEVLHFADDGCEWVAWRRVRLGCRHQLGERIRALWRRCCGCRSGSSRGGLSRLRLRISSGYWDRLGHSRLNAASLRLIRCREWISLRRH